MQLGSIWSLAPVVRFTEPLRMLQKFLISLLLMIVVGIAAFAALWVYSISRKTTPEQKLQALETEVKAKGGQIFRTVLMGQPKVFLLLDCSLYLLDASGEEIKRDKVLTTGFYFGLAGCTDQSISIEGEYLNVYLANRAIGAGGGNTTGGNYRSKDGKSWEKKSAKGWHPVDDTL